MICKYLRDYLPKYLQIYQLLTINYKLNPKALQP